MTISKRYRATKVYKLTITANIDGRSVLIEFGGFDKYREVRGSYTTRDKKVQKFLEESPMFGRYYVLEQERVILPPKKADDSKPDKLELKHETFRTLNDCKFFIEKTLGLKAYQFSNKAKCIEVCREHGYEIEFESK